MPKPGEVDPRLWRSGKQFLLTSNGEIYEKDAGNCWLWESYRGVFRRDQTLPPTSWIDLVRDRSPLISITVVEAILILALRFTQEVYTDATSDLAQHKADNDHYTPKRG